MTTVDQRSTEIYCEYTYKRIFTVTTGKLKGFEHYFSETVKAEISFDIHKHVSTLPITGFGR